MNKIGSDIENDVNVRVYIDLAADQEKTDQLEAKIKELADVESVTFRSKDEELEDKNAHSNDWQIEEIHFANGEVMTYEEMMKQPFEYYGDEQDNTINTYSTDDKIFAGAGDDRIHAGDGNDTLVGRSRSESVV